MAEQISIHAPPRGATEFTAHQDGLETISIHAPPRGATVTSTILRGATTNFNSRPSARGDAAEEARDAWNAISIHAPPRGATPPGQPQIRTACVFQFTPLREGRQVYKSHGFGRTYFNSRPSARGDCRLHNSCSRQFQFQFTPLREGRQLVKVRSCEQLISIHAPPRGATGIRRILPEKICGNFNSRPSARGDGNPWEKRTGGAVLDLSEDKVAGRADHDQLRPALQYHPFVSLFAR